MSCNSKAAKNMWDSIAERFNTHKHKKDIHPDAAVNLYVGWPVFFDQIKKHTDFLGRKTCRIMDFGCGAGSFCRELHKQGHNVTGMDISEKMLALAKSNLPKTIELINDDQLRELVDDEENHGTYDVITSIHSLDWIEEDTEVLKTLSKLLKTDGIFIFGIFPQRHVIDSLKINDLFEDFDSIESPNKGYANFDGIKIPVFVRKADYYDRFFSEMKFEKVLEAYPPYPKLFFSKFQWSGSKYPEMLILSYRKDHY